MIGRKKELQRFKEAMESDQSEFIAVYGRRRVGKTFLIRQAFANRFTFAHTGVARESMAGQLANFHDSLVEYGSEDCPVPETWLEAFRRLKKVISGSKEARKVVFIDEMPWMDTPRSNFTAALEHFWNGWASARNDVVLIVCGSATSWIINKVIHNKGGLHNRVTGKIHLRPFTLAECEEYADARHLGMSRSQVAEAYMVLGGVPHYWSFLRKDASLAQNIDRMFFSEDGELKDEFYELYASLFKRKEPYEAIVTALAGKKSGMTRDEIVVAAKTANNGRLTERLAELEQCGFIRSFHVVGACASAIVYQLMDSFTIFHFNFIVNNKRHSEVFWSSSLGSPMYNAWRGLSFERLCLQHVGKIKEAIGIGGVDAEVGCWRHVADERYPHGAQIDLVIDRADNVVDLCEMKCTDSPYRVTDTDMADLKRKCDAYRTVTRTKKSIHTLLVSANGTEPGMYRNEINCEVTLDALFA